MRICGAWILILYWASVLGQSEAFETVLQKGHAEAVKALALSPDGKYLASGSRDKSVILWEVSSGFQIRSILGHEHTVNGISFSSEGKRIATSSADGTARIWDIETGEQIWSSKSFREYVTDVAISPDGRYLAVAGYESSIWIYSLSNLDTIVTIKVSPDKGVGYGVSLSFSPNSQYLATGEDNRTARIFNTSNWAEVAKFQPEDGWCGGCGTLIAFDDDGKHFGKASNNGPIVIYSWPEAELVHVLEEEVDDVTAIRFGKDSFYMSFDDIVKIYDLKSGILTDSIVFRDDKVNALEFDLKEKRLSVALESRQIASWDVRTGTFFQRFDGILSKTDPGGVNYDLGSYWDYYIAKYLKYNKVSALSDDGRYLLKGKSGKTARVWDLKTGRISVDLQSSGTAITAINTLEDYTVTGSADGYIQIFNNDVEKFTVKAHREPVFDITFSHDQNTFATCSWDGYVYIFELKTGRKLKSINLGNVAAYDLSFTSNDVYLILSKLDKTLELWEIDTATPVKTFVGHTDVVSEITMDGNRFLTTSWDGSVIEWDLYSGLIIRKYKHAYGGVYDLELLDENRFISVGADRNVYLWNRTDKRADGRILGKHLTEVSGVCISGNVLTTTDIDGISKIWDIEAFEEKFEHIQVGRYEWMTRTPDGYFSGTDEALQHINFVRGLTSIAADQLFKRFYKPDLLESLGKKSEQNVRDLLSENPPAEIEIAGFKEPEDLSASVFIKYLSNRSSIKELKVFHNGKRLDLSEQDMKVEDNVVELKINLVAGPNEFKAIATNKASIDSRAVSWTTNASNTVPASTCYILTIGINEYQNSQLNLNYANADAISFGAKLVELGQGLYHEMIEVKILDSDGSRLNIIDRLKEVAEVITANDVFVFYYAGHGVYVNEEYFLVPTETKRLYDEKVLEKTALSATELQHALSGISALKQLIVLDACQSGGSVELLAQRGGLEEKAIAQLSRSSGIHVLASAGSEQYATEFDQLGHGLFTYILLEALSGKADGAPKDGKVTINELRSYLDARVPEKSAQLKGVSQYPYTFSRGNDFPLVLVRE